ncbi:S1 family peptidase [Streptomyces sp. Inha503]|uniref:S1 family peptidase n=1 Tax=Streptomyces sp. Inha503 TaxID=3383314 RepID=UPI0039A04D41
MKTSSIPRTLARTTATRRLWRQLATAAAALIAATAGTAVPAHAINGGEEAKKPYSFMSSLQGRADGKHFCGGTLIARQWILTAYHCLEDHKAEDPDKLIDPDTMQVRIGSNDKTRGGELRRVQRFVLPPGDDPDSNDIALLKLDRPVGSAPAALPRTAPRPGDKVRILGWGDHLMPDKPGDPWPDNPQPRMLRQLDTRLIERRHCPEIGGELPPNSSSQLCVSSLPGAPWPQTSRAGDSGGPVLARTGGTWTVQGAASRGSASEQQHGIYTSVHAYAAWIHGVLKQDRIRELAGK